jgi:membrane fusion protein, multidrug efflux system
MDDMNSDNDSDKDRKVWKHRFESKKAVWIVVCIFIIIVALVFRFWAASKKPKKTPSAVSVVTTPVQSQNVPVYLVALGTVTPLDSVTVKTQVNGQLQKVYFKEGQMVRKGTVLAQIDERPLRAQLIQYEGQLERDRALLANALIDLGRYELLFKEDSVSQQTLETQRWLVKQYEGAVKTDQGLIEGVKVNLIYAKITSPVDGRVGLRLVDPGNYVQTSDTTGLFVLNTLEPITVLFTLPEDDIQKVMKQVNAKNTLSALAYNRTQTEVLAQGTLLAVDNQVNTSTGTIKLKAIFTNREKTLFPNQFVNIHLLVETIENALIIPTASVLHGATGDFVYVLQANQKVKVVPIKTGVTFGDNIIVTSGLSFGDIVVVEGTDKLAEGTKVKTTSSPAEQRLHESV